MKTCLLSILGALALAGCQVPSSESSASASLECKRDPNSEECKQSMTPPTGPDPADGCETPPPCSETASGTKCAPPPCDEKDPNCAPDKDHASTIRPG